MKLVAEYEVDRLTRALREANERTVALTAFHHDELATLRERAETAETAGKVAREQMGRMFDICEKYCAPTNDGLSWGPQRYPDPLAGWLNTPERVEAQIATLTKERNVMELRAQSAEALFNAAGLGKAAAEHRLADVCEERDTLAAQVAVLREALEPFAKLASPPSEGVDYSWHGMIAADLLRKAQAALSSDAGSALLAELRELREDKERLLAELGADPEMWEGLKKERAAIDSARRK